MTFTLDQAYTVIDLVGFMMAKCWWVLDSVTLFTNGSTSVSVLDGFLIAGFVVDAAWEILDELRA